jgi:hypothetical protein
MADRKARIQLEGIGAARKAFVEYGTKSVQTKGDRAFDRRPDGMEVACG